MDVAAEAGSQLTDIDAAVAAALRDPRLLVAMPLDRAEAMADAADRHGVPAVLLNRAATAGIPSGAILDPLRGRASAAAAAAALRDQESIRMIACLRRAGIPHIVIKGLALAYSLYAQPWMRPRSDTDLLVRERDIPRLDALFRAEGYALLPHVRGEVTLPQRHYHRVEASGFRHNWDLHWRLTASHVLADAPRDGELWAGARPLEAIGGAEVPAWPHALMIACVHRLAHHHDDPRLIWLWDIRLLLEAMSPGDISTFERLARSAPAPAAACGRSLAVARDACGAQVPPVLGPLLAAASASNPAAFLWSGSRRQATYLFGELRAMPGARRRRALREHLLPSPASMRERYPSVPRALLPLLYPWRLIVGVPRWLSGR